MRINSKRKGRSRISHRRPGFILALFCWFRRDLCCLRVPFVVLLRFQSATTEYHCELALQGVFFRGSSFIVSFLGSFFLCSSFTALTIWPSIALTSTCVVAGFASSPESITMW